MSVVILWPRETALQQLNEEEKFKIILRVDETAAPYQEGMYKSGYTYKLEFKPPQRASPQRRNQPRKIIWFNPPRAT